MNDIEVLARRRLALVEQRDSIDAAIKAVDAQITDAVEVGGTVEVDGQPAFRIMCKRTFSVDRAKELLPETLIEAATVPTVDTKLLKSLMPPALVSKCMTTGAVYVAKARA